MPPSPIQMTRAQYQAKYGALPVASQPSAPIQMTHAQYMAKYGNQTPQETPIVSNPITDINQAGADVNAAITGQDIGQGVPEGQSAAQKGVRAASTAAGAVINTVADVIPGGKSALGAIGSIFKGATDFAGNIGNTMADISQKIGLMTPEQRVQYDKQASDFEKSTAGQVTRNVSDTLNNLGNIANVILGAKGVAEGIPRVKNAVVDTTNIIKGINAVSDTIPKVPPPTPILNEAKVTDLYNRAIKPTVAGKVNANQVATGNARVISGMQSIADNKPSLTFTDVNGETITGQTPKTVDQFSQAITQTKASIFKQYDALAKQAGEQGVVVNAPKIAMELDPVINSSSLKITNPKAVAYAERLQKRLNAAGGIDAVTAQEVIQNYNESLKAFYRNPTYETASQASIDALIANKFREQLDAGITNATGAQYQALKNQYGALAAMEKDVAHRAIVWGRQNAVGLAGNLANITSGAELVRGLITLNPADIAASVAIKGIQKYIQYLNNPDVGVQRIFSEINRASPPATGSTISPKVEGKVGKP